MPVLRFKCLKCEHEWRDITDDDHSKCPKCETLNHFEIPSGAATLVMETIDKNRGVKTRKNQDRMIKDRMTKHHDKYEVAEKIDKFGFNDAIRHGWTKKVKRT